MRPYRTGTPRLLARTGGSKEATNALAMVIRALGAEPPPHELERVTQVLGQTYPIMGLDSLEKSAAFARDLGESARNPYLHWIVAEEGGDLRAVMALYDFTMNVRGTDAPAGGVGSLAVALGHKRRGIARAMIAWYLEYYREGGAAFAQERAQG